MRGFSETSFDNETLEKIYCNLCGRQITRNCFGYLEDHLSVTKTWGYGPPADGETHSFDICYDCYDKVSEQFKIPLKVFSGLPEMEHA